MHAPAGERGQLEERRAAVEQARDALARQELAALLELFRLLRRMRDDGPLQARNCSTCAMSCAAFALKASDCGEMREAITGMSGRSPATLS